MRILLIHNRYALRGGEDESTDAEQALLEENGEAVDLYEVSNEGLPSSTTLEPRRLHSAFLLGTRSIWSRAAYRNVYRRVESFRPDVVHVQNSFPQLSPAVHHAARAAGAAVVQTLRNYRQLCPKASFYRDGNTCEDCLGKRFPTPSLQHGCYRDSRAATAWVAGGQVIHNAIGTWETKVDLYISPSDYTKRKFVDSGFAPAERIVVKPNFLVADPGPGDGAEGHYLYVGRLSAEKGIRTLMAAWPLVADGQQLTIIGNGPLNREVDSFVRRNPEVTWRGRVPNHEVLAEMGRARALVFPSEWYETFGRVAMEAFARGTPVIGADIGAVGEIVGGSAGGVLFAAGDAAALADRINTLATDHERVAEMRREARLTYEAKYRADQNYDQLIAAYEQARHNADPVNRRSATPSRAREAGRPRSRSGGPLRE
ncbi:MAG: glycosyltransferase family 4 protein [Acidimicrobiia bacterium]|nr:glycosyltransferase family 4 protein [Acidimicrobiia bacterium]